MASSDGERVLLCVNLFVQVGDDRRLRREVQHLSGPHILDRIIEAVERQDHSPQRGIPVLAMRDTCEVADVWLGYGQRLGGRECEANVIVRTLEDVVL